MARTNEDKIRALIPIDSLTSIFQAAVIKQGEVLTFSAGQVIYKQNQEDDFAHFLLEGGVDCLWNGARIKAVWASDRAARRALDTMGPKRYTVLAVNDVAVFRLRRSQLQRALEQSELSDRPSELTVSDIQDDESSDWMVQLLRSPIFQKLSSSDIHHVLDRMEKLSVSKNDVIITQGEPGDYYYVIQEGACAVRRKSSGGEVDFLLAELGPGDTFGEEALIGDTSRNAQIVMLSDGQLLRLDKESFVDLLRNQLIEEVDFGDAEALVHKGAIWLDVRSTSEFEKGSLKDAINIPVEMLRLDCRKHSKDPVYIVCSENPRMAAVGTFVLMQRGFDARLLAMPITEVLAEKAVESAPAPNEETSTPSPAAPEGIPEATERVDPEQFADTITGKTLAELIEEIYDSRKDATAVPSATSSRRRTPARPRRWSVCLRLPPRRISRWTTKNKGRMPPWPMTNRVPIRHRTIDRGIG